MNHYQVEIIDAENELNNYIFILCNTHEKSCVVIDPTRADLVKDFCQKQDYRIEQIWITHKHDDHIAGLAELKQFSQAQVFAPKAEQAQIQLADVWLDDGEHFVWHDLNVQSIATAGHTLGHICFYIEECNTLFSGDTLFVMGCGRVFEGSLAQMYDSLNKLKQLPEQTLIYCSHEYTESNARFAHHIMPDNPLITQRYQQIIAQRQAKQPTVPTRLDWEKSTNVFLLAPDFETFCAFRQQKDQF